MNRCLILFMLFFSFPVVSTENISGNIFKWYNQFYIKNGQQLLETFELEDKYKYSLSSLHSSDKYFFKIRGNTINQEFIGNTFPLLVGGSHTTSGILKKINGKYFVDNTNIKIGRTLDVNGNSFDELSIKSFIDKEVRVEGNLTGDTLVINSILDKDIYKILDDSIFEDGINKDNINFILDEMPKNIHSQSSNIIKKNVYFDKNKKVHSGDTVLVITLSGRQGDDVTASPGHFATGFGIIDKNLEIDAEILNLYTASAKEKENISSNTSLNHYFGHIIQGQNNYRPTYTLFFYGVSQEKLDKMNIYLNKTLHKYRTEDIFYTIDNNCTTATNLGIEKTCLKGDHRRKIKQIFDIQNFGYLNPFYYIIPSDWTFGQINHILADDKENFLPRPAFESYVRTVLNNSELLEELNIKRVDFLFNPQVPSKRPIGGISFDEASEAFSASSLTDSKDQKEISEFLNSID